MIDREINNGNTELQEAKILNMAVAKYYGVVKEYAEILTASRELNAKEIEKNEVSIVKILDEKVVCLADPADFTKENAENELRKNRTREKQFAFDFAFNEKTPT